MFMAQIDVANSSLTYIGAGHEAFLSENGSDDFVKLASTGYPLGLLPEITVGCGQIGPLAAGQILALFTDGFQEARSPAEEFFGVTRVLDVIRENRTKSAQQIVDRLFASVANFCQPQHPQDDITAVIVKVDA